MFGMSAIVSVLVVFDWPVESAFEYTEPRYLIRAYFPAGTVYEVFEREIVTGLLSKGMMIFATKISY